MNTKNLFIALACGVAITGASLLLSTTALAGEASCNEAQEDAWDHFQDRHDFAEDLSGVYDTNPEVNDCEKICKGVSKSCRKVLGTDEGSNKHEIKSDLKVGKSLCATIEDEEAQKACKDDLKEMATGAKDDAKANRDDIKAACDDANMMESCMDVCGGGLEPEACEDSFFDIIII